MRPGSDANWTDRSLRITGSPVSSTRSRTRLELGPDLRDHLGERESDPVAPRKRAGSREHLVHVDDAEVGVDEAGAADCTVPSSESASAVRRSAWRKLSSS
jgi:hypothetical protein